MRLSKKAQPGSQKACRAVIRQQTWLPRLGHASSSRSSEAGGNPSSLRPKGPLPPAAELWVPAPVPAEERTPPGRKSLAACGRGSATCRRRCCGAAWSSWRRRRVRRAGHGPWRGARGPEGSDWEGGKGAARALRPGPSLSVPTAPRAAPGQAKASGAPVKRTRRERTKAAQALKLRNSAKGKVPKSALGELGMRLRVLLPRVRGQRLRGGAPNITPDSTRKRQGDLKWWGTGLEPGNLTSQVWALSCVSLLLSAV